ncbi:MAG: FAD/NAD(P)-binding protein [Verrucomicrobia bacterium]|nr:FAD/NAD(P)-binding protein [Verrucomicrobiota bacterium]
MSVTENIYEPKPAVLERVVDEIDEVKTFYWRFIDESEQRRFLERFEPGQFAQVSIFGHGEFPASLPPSPTEGELFFTVRKVGSATSAMHEMGPGAVFGVRGPYGNGFKMESYAGMNLVFVAGGIGMIPLRSCIVYALANREMFGDVKVFYGAREPRGLMYMPLWREYEESKDVECHLTVDKADAEWSGHVGVVGSLFKKRDVNLTSKNTVAFVCGPPVMFRFVIRDLKTLGFSDSQIISTLERYMKCGVGKCGHCCIGVAYVCVDGPVFTYKQIKQLGEDI